MPVADLPLRYRSKLGAPNGILTPPDDIAPYGLDPDYAGAQDLSTDAPDIPNQANIPAPPDDATEAEQANSVALPSLSTKDKLPKRLPKPSMLPPEESEPPTAPMPATPPIPQALQPQAPPAATLPSVELGDMDHTPAVSGNPIDRSPVKVKSDDSASDKLGSLKAPDAPSNNWAQRLGLAVLSLTRFAPVANQLMHPKYAEQRRAYETQREDLEESQKEDIAQAQADSLNAQRDASAAQKNALAANYGQTQDTRKYAANDRLEAAFEKAMGPDAVQLGPNDQVPPGFTAFNSPSNQKWARRSPFVTVPQELAEEFPGLPPGSQITRAELDRALQSARAKSLADHVAGNKAAKPQYTGVERMAIAAEGGDPDDPNIDPAILQKALTRVKPAGVSVTNQLSPEAIQGIGDTYGRTGNMVSLGLGKEAAAMRASILNQYFKGHPSANVAEASAIFHADKASLAKLQSNRDSVVAFENTAGKNLDQFLTQAKRVVDTGSPLINQPIRAINRAALGGADQAAFDAARKVALTEIAKVVSSPGLSGQLSDSARKEVESLSPENATLGQIYRVASVLRQDMANRHESYDNMLDEIKGRLGGGGGASGTQQQAPIIQHSPSTGQYRHSLDGGKTWLPGQP